MNHCSCLSPIVYVFRISAAGELVRYQEPVYKIIIEELYRNSPLHIRFK